MLRSQIKLDFPDTSEKFTLRLSNGIHQAVAGKSWSGYTGRHLETIASVLSCHVKVPLQSAFMPHPDCVSLWQLHSNTSPLPIGHHRDIWRERTGSNVMIKTRLRRNIGEQLSHRQATAKDALQSAQ